METKKLMLIVLDLAALGFKNTIGAPYEGFQSWEHDAKDTPDKAWYSLRMIWSQEKEHWLMTFESYIGEEGKQKAWKEYFAKKKVKSQEKLVRILAEAGYPPAVEQYNIIENANPKSPRIKELRAKTNLNESEVFELFELLSDKDKIKVLLKTLKVEGSKSHKIAKGMGYWYSTSYNEPTWTNSPYH